MNKSKIVARVAARMGLDRFMAEGAVDTDLAAIAAGLAKEEDVRIVGFGTLMTRSRPARTGESEAIRLRRGVAKADCSTASCRSIPV